MDMICLWTEKGEGSRVITADGIDSLLEREGKIKGGDGSPSLLYPSLDMD